MLAVVAWRLLVQAPLRDLVPRSLGERLPRSPGVVGADLPWLALGVVVGAVHRTSCGTRSPTHGRWGVDLVPWLHAEHLGLPGYTWAQYASGALGLVVLAVWGVRRLAGPALTPKVWSTLEDRRVAWALVVAGALTGVAVALLAFPGSPERTLVRAVTLGGTAAAGGLAAGLRPLVGSHAAPDGSRRRVAFHPMARSIATTTRSTSTGCSTSPATTPDGADDDPGRRAATGVAGHRRRRPQGRIVISTYPERAKTVNARRTRGVGVLVLSDDFGGAWVQVDGDCEVIDLPDSVEPLVDYFRVHRG